MFFFGGAYFTLLYYLPIYFQSVQNSSPIGSGVKTLALIIPLSIAAIGMGFAVAKIGIMPLFWVPSCCTPWTSQHPPASGLATRF